MQRRTLLRTVGAGAISGLAGCGALSSNDTANPPTQTPIGTGEEPVWQPRARPDGIPITDIVGTTHSNGTYHFTDDDYLNEGAKRVRSLGSAVIKVWLHLAAEKYEFNSDYRRRYSSMVDLAKTAPYRELFERPFSTFVLLAQAYPRPRIPAFYEIPSGWGLSDREREEVRDRFAALTRHLLETYDGTGKTFVLQHWEGDNLFNLRGGSGDFDTPLPAEVAEAMRGWLTARQRGVERVRNRVESDVTVLHAAEVNLVLDAMEDGTSRMINEVIPDVDVDLVSYSAWELAGQLAGERWAAGQNGRVQFEESERIVKDALTYIDEQAPDPNAYVRGSLTESRTNVFLGEFGSPFQRDGPEISMRKIRSVLEPSLDWGVRWAIYWQLYCNEKTVEGEVTENDDVNGHYLIRPDGTKAQSWDYFAEVLDRETTF